MLWEPMVAVDWEEHVSETAVRNSLFQLSAASWVMRFSQCKQGGCFVLAVVHSCHRPWYIGENISCWISRFAEIALRWCKRWQTVTRIFCHIITDDDRRQIPHVVRRTTYYTAFPRGIATSSYPKDINRYHLGICVIILDHTVGIWKILPLGLSPRT